MSLPSFNFLHLTVSEIQPWKDFQTQGHYGKVKGQINVTPSRCTSTSPNQCPYVVLTSYTLQFLRYSLDTILKVKVTTARSNQGNTLMLHTITANQCHCPISTSYTSQFLRYSPDRIVKFNVTTAWSKVKSRSHLKLHTYTP